MSPGSGRGKRRANESRNRGLRLDVGANVHVSRLSDDTRSLKEHAVRSVSIVVSVALFLGVASDPLGAQSQERDDDGGVSLTVRGVGLTLGPVPRASGLRINWRDRHLESVNGINLTVWLPRGEPRVGGTVNGMALGVLGPQAGVVNGLALGLGAVVGEERLSGLGVAGLALVSSGDAHGIHMGGLATVTRGHMAGIQAGGLAVVSRGGVEGLSAAGLATVADGPLSGIHGAGLALVAGERVTGASLSGLALVTEGGVWGLHGSGLALVGARSVEGLNLGGLALVSEGPVTGFNVGGVALVGGALRGFAGSLGAAVGSEIQGLAVGGLAVVSGGAVQGAALSAVAVEAGSRLQGLATGVGRIRAPVIQGTALSLGHLKAWDVSGFTVAGYTQVRGRQQGLAVGLYNSARELRGVQIGLLNRADNNPTPFRYLPFVNLHF